MDSRKQRKILFINMAMAALLVSLILFVMEVSGAATVPSIKDTGNGYDLFSKVYSRVITSYVKDTDPWNLSKDAIKGILKNLDPYSDFYDPKDFKQLQDETRGAFGGIGIEIAVNPEKNYPQVMAYPMADTPAEKVGLRARDLIVEIDGVSTKGMDINDVVGKLRGKADTPVTIKVKRGNSDDLIEKKLIRAIIPLNNVAYSGEIHDGIGYIKLLRFNQEASEEMDAALKKLKEAKVRGVILDLRNNPGGLLTAAKQISNKFLKEGMVVVKTRGRDQSSEDVLTADGVPRVPDLPLVVLVNQGSASASEIVAGAIQDHDRGVIIGETTFGKGSVQTVYDDMPEGTGLKLTTALYYTPSGRSIHKDRKLDEIILASMEEDDSGDSAESSQAQADSLKNRPKYLTDNKRVVYGGGGITPDIVIKEKPVGNYVGQLFAQSVFYEFAGDYADSHPNLSRDFTVDDKLMNEFKTYVDSSKNFNYSIPGKANLDKFRDNLKREDYNGNLLSMVDSMEKAVIAERDKDFWNHAETIKRILKREIASNKFGAAERTIASKDYDVQLQKAIEVLNNPTEYTSLLTIGVKTGKK